MIAQLGKEELLPTTKDVEFWNENGYWIAPVLFDEETVERLRNAMYRVWAAEFETGREPWGGPWRLDENPHAIRKMDQSHWANDTIRELVTSEAVGAIASRLSGEPEIRLWHDQMLYKPGQGRGGEGGGNVGWHQDLHYWQCAEGELLTAWVALDDVDESNGCMHFVPGSHRWGLLEGDFFNQDMDGMRRRMEQESGRKFGTVPCRLKAGQVSFHHCLTIHGSGPNRTDRPRRSFVLHLHSGATRYRAGTCCDNHMNAILMRELERQDGDRFAGSFWPVLYRAGAEG